MSSSKASSTMPEGEEHERVQVISLDLPKTNPPERDDTRAALLRLDLLGEKSQPVVVPYFYGYPLYAEGSAVQGLRMFRQENWEGYSKEERADADGVVHLIESFPVLGCVFEGVQEDESTYVPLSLECNVPPPKARGAQRPLVGTLSTKTKAEAIPTDGSLSKAFLGEWHATKAAPDGVIEAGYFNTPYGLVGFNFKKGKVSGVSFVFDPAERRWRKPELWMAPLGYTVAQ